MLYLLVASGGKSQTDAGNAASAASYLWRGRRGISCGCLASSPKATYSLHYSKPTLEENWRKTTLFHHGIRRALEKYLKNVCADKQWRDWRVIKKDVTLFCQSYSRWSTICMIYLVIRIPGCNDPESCWLLGTQGVNNIAATFLLVYHESLVLVISCTTTSSWKKTLVVFAFPAGLPDGV